MMTHDEMIAVIQAHQQGRQLQYSSHGAWFDVEGTPLFNFATHDYRIKPEPKLRPWKPEDVPVGCAIRKKSDHACWAIITACLDNRPKLGLLTSYDCNPFENFIIEFEQFEWKHLHEPDTAWKPCGVEE